MKNTLKKILPDLLFIVGFALIAILYCSPVLQNKVLISNDPTQALGLAKESIDYKDKFGEIPWWTNSAFGGMPTYFITSFFPYSLFAAIGYYIKPLPGGYPANDIFLVLIGAYILLMSFQKNRWLASLGAIGYAFCTLTILFLEAGHSSKIEALAFAPIILAGIVYAYKNKKLQAVLAFSIGLGFELNANHLQITYYLVLACVVFVAFLLYYSYKEGSLRPFFINLILISVGGGLATATQSARLLSTLEYSKESIRGTSELTLPSDNSSSSSEGLSKDYAFSWSYGKVESFTFLIPQFSGGVSNGTFPKNSATASTLSGLGISEVNIKQFLPSLPSYWGDQAFVAGPAYLGAILCFLFVLGSLISSSRLRFPFLACVILLLFVSWGDNFKMFGYFLFDHLPMYNKFRAVNMGVSLMQLFFVSLALLGVVELLNGKKNYEDLKNPLLISLGLTAGICVLFWVIPGMFFDFTVAKDVSFVESLKQSFGNNPQAANSVYNALLEDRETLVKQDSLRSLVFILLSAALIVAYLKSRLSKTGFVIGLLLLSSVDLWQVDKRYFNNEDFDNKRNISSENQFPKTQADLAILSDPDPNFRVINTTTGFWSSAKESYYHKSIGGYHGAKLKRAQELYEHAIIKDGRLNMNVLNMMNTKYFMINGAEGPQSQLNTEALGNAWYVDSLIYASSANEEMTVLSDLDTRNLAVVDARFGEALNFESHFNTDSVSIRLTEYLPNNLKYSSSAQNDGFVVFSEMFYKGNQDWKSYIDGQEVSHVRVNYALRGMLVPSGNHEIEFKFKPVVIDRGNKIDLASSILFILFMVGMTFNHFRTKTKEEE